MWTKVKHEYDPITGSRSYMDGWVDEDRIIRATYRTRHCHHEEPKAQRVYILVGVTEDGQQQFRGWNRYTFRLDEAYGYMHEAKASQVAVSDLIDCSWLDHVQVWEADRVPMASCTLLRQVFQAG